MIPECTSMHNAEGDMPKQFCSELGTIAGIALTSATVHSLLSFLMLLDCLTCCWILASGSLATVLLDLAFQPHIAP